MWVLRLLKEPAIKVFLEVKIKSVEYYREVAVASSREIELGQRTSQISQYQIHLLLQQTSAMY